MINALETLKQVKAVLGIEIKLEQMKLENGAVIEADKFETGESVFIVSEDEKVALPVGEFELEDGRILKVEEEGIIASIGEVKDDEEDEEEVEQTETEMEEEKKEMEYVSREEFSTALDEIKAAIDEIKAGYDKKEMSEEVEETNEEVTEETSEELSEEVSEETEEVAEETDEQKELNAELSKPAVQPFKHSPEKVADREMVRFAQNKPKSILDTVFEKLNK